MDKSTVIEERMPHGERQLARIIVDAIRTQGRTMHDPTGMQFNIYKASGLIMNEEFLCAAHEKYWERVDSKNKVEAAA